MTTCPTSHWHPCSGAKVHNHGRPPRAVLEADRALRREAGQRTHRCFARGGVTDIGNKMFSVVLVKVAFFCQKMPSKNSIFLQ
jgi:hypothetical protein